MRDQGVLDLPAELAMARYKVSAAVGADIVFGSQLNRQFSNLSLAIIHHFEMSFMNTAGTVFQLASLL